MLMMESCNKYIDHKLDQLRHILTVGLFEKVEKFFIVFAEIATPLAAVLGSLIALVLAIKTDSLQIFLASFAWVFTLVICYYIGGKLQNACQKTLESNPSSIGNQEYLDVVTVLNLIGAATSLLAGIYFAVKFSYLQAFVIGLGVALLLIYSAWLTLQPELLTTYVQESSSAGLDAIAILVLANKIYLRSNKIIFGLLTAIGTVLLVQALFNSFGEPYEILMGGFQGLLGFILVIAGLTAPFACYVLFVFSYMLLDVMRSMLGLGKPNLPIKTTPHAHTETASAESGISADAAKKIGLVLIALIVGLTAVIKGKDLYNDYQAKAEVRRMEEEQKKAEEAAQKAAAEAEAARIEAFTSNARKYVKKPALDLVLDSQINGLYREIFGNNTSAFEGYFAESSEVFEAEDLLLAPGCRKDQCDQYKALAIVDLKGTKVSAIVIMGTDVRLFGIQEADAPAAVKKWLMANRR
ncbi:MAG: hypothetical protein RLZ36_825 [Pseudomonadota bacterium]|jgi:hypothetical protein